MDKVVDVLIVSCHGFARGPMAEALMSVLSKGRIRAFNAPILPADRVHPLAEELISAIGYQKEETLEPLNIFDQWQLRGKQADFIFCVSKESAVLGFGNWPGDPLYIEYIDYEELYDFDDMRYEVTPRHAPVGSCARRAAFRRVFEQMAADIRKYIVRVLSIVDGQKIALAERPRID